MVELTLGPEPAMLTLAAFPGLPWSDALLLSAPLPSDETIVLVVGDDYTVTAAMSSDRKTAALSIPADTLDELLAANNRTARLEHHGDTVSLWAVGQVCHGKARSTAINGGKPVVIIRESVTVTSSNAIYGTGVYGAGIYSPSS